MRPLVRFAIVAFLSLVFGILSQAQTTTAYDRALERILVAKETNATELRLSNLYLNSIPPEVWELRQLTRLDLSYNSISVLPAEIAQLSNLQSLWLRNNQLTTLPAEIGSLSQLRDLDLQYNQINSLPREFAQLQNMEYLQFGNNPLVLPARIEQLSYRMDDRALVEYLSDSVGYNLRHYGMLALIGLVLMILAWYFRKLRRFIAGTLIGAIAGGLLLNPIIYILTPMLSYGILLLFPLLPFEDSGWVIGAVLGILIAFIFFRPKAEIRKAKSQFS